MNLFNLILKQKPSEAKCMQLFLSKLKMNKEAKELLITEAEAKDYENFDALLDVMKNQTYINWEKTENGDYKIELTDNFFKVFKGVINML